MTHRKKEPLVLEGKIVEREASTRWGKNQVKVNMWCEPIKRNLDGSFLIVYLPDDNRDYHLGDKFLITIQEK